MKQFLKYRVIKNYVGYPVYIYYIHVYYMYIQYNTLAAFSRESSLISALR